MKWGLRLERIKGSWYIRRRDKGQITQSLFNKASRNHTILYLSTITHNIYCCYYRHERKVLAIWLVRVVQVTPKTIEIINVAPIAEDTAHVGLRTLTVWIGSELKASFLQSSLTMVPNRKYQGKEAIQRAYAAAISMNQSHQNGKKCHGACGTHISVATHSCLIGLKIHSTFWHFKSYPYTHS